MNTLASSRILRTTDAEINSFTTKVSFSTHQTLKWFMQLILAWYCFTVSFTHLFTTVWKPLSLSPHSKHYLLDNLMNSWSTRQLLCHDIAIGLSMEYFCPAADYHNWTLPQFMSCVICKTDISYTEKQLTRDLLSIENSTQSKSHLSGDSVLYSNPFLVLLKCLYADLTWKFCEPINIIFIISAIMWTCLQLLGEGV